MAGSVNKVILVGNVGADPEIRRTQDGRPIAGFSLATSESWTDKNTGEKREKTEWHRIVVFNEGLCKVIEPYVKKGSKLYLEGRLQTRKWQDQSGQEKYITEVVLQGFNGRLVMLGGKNQEQGQTESNSRSDGNAWQDTKDQHAGQNNQSSDNACRASKDGRKDMGQEQNPDDEIPF